MSNEISSKIQELELSFDTINRTFEINLMKLDADRAKLVSSPKALSSNQRRRLSRLQSLLGDELDHHEIKRQERDNFFAVSQESRELRIDLHSTPSSPDA